MRLGLRSRIFLFFVAIVVGAIAALGFGLWFGYHRAGTPGMFDAFLQAGLAAGFCILGFVAWIWFLFDTHFARPIEGVASAMRVRAHADVDDDIEAPGARYIGDLAAAASAAATRLAHTRSSLAQSVARETSRLSADKAKLEQLLADVPPAVLLCTGRHHLVFYNGVARQLLGGGQRPVFLDRNLFDYLDDGAIRDAHHRLRDAEMPGDVIEFLCRSPCGTRRLAGRMRLVGDAAADDGAYVMTLRDVTGEVAAYARRDALLSEVFETVHPSVRLLKSILGDGDRPVSPGSIAALEQEIDALDAALSGLAERFDLCRSDGWPMAPAEARELARLLHLDLAADGLGLEVDAGPVAARCNAFDVVSLLSHLARKVAGRGVNSAFRLAIHEREAAMEIVLAWDGSGVVPEDLQAWLSQPVRDDGLSGEAILRAHATEIRTATMEEGTGFALTLRPVERVTSVAASATRSVVYDFDLLTRAQYDRIAEARLDDLTYVVFDTETTGLLPDQGDEIVQIAAVRVVNGKPVQGERFETLVQPGRLIPASATAVHGITDAMVEGAPSVTEAIRQFHRFAEGSVLVAHNAPFDMEFLYRREREIGARFVNPVLDTVLLSAVVFGQGETHTLDALVQRLSITIHALDRHTAMGDAIATMEAFLKLKAILVGRGFDRFGDVLSEVRRHRRLVKDLNGKIGVI